jgi:hypothetical protein
MQVPDVEIAHLRAFWGGEAADMACWDHPGTSGADWEDKFLYGLTRAVVGGGRDAGVEGAICVEGGARRGFVGRFWHMGCDVRHDVMVVIIRWELMVMRCVDMVWDIKDIYTPNPSRTKL